MRIFPVWSVVDGSRRRSGFGLNPLVGPREQAVLLDDCAGVFVAPGDRQAVVESGLLPGVELGEIRKHVFQGDARVVGRALEDFSR